jgi:hypothetical protein
MRILVWICFGLASVTGGIAGAPSPFLFVMIDSQTEVAHGGLPFDRALVAKAINKLADAKAKGIIIKFFYDLPSTEEKDRALELSICAAPVAIQACLNDADGSTNALEAKFGMAGKPLESIPDLFSGRKGYVPLGRFLKCAKGVGFVDSTATEIPLLEIYQGSMVKSLHLIALEMASDKKTVIDPAGFVRLGGKQIELMHEIRFPATNSLTYIPFHEVISERSKNWQSKVEKSIVILGYDGKNIHSIETPIGPMGAHRFFINGLLSVAKSFEEADEQRK